MAWEVWGEQQREVFYWAVLEEGHAETLLHS